MPATEEKSFRCAYGIKRSDVFRRFLRPEFGNCGVRDGYGDHVKPSLV